MMIFLKPIVNKYYIKCNDHQYWSTSHNFSLLYTYWLWTSVYLATERIWRQYISYVKCRS